MNMAKRLKLKVLREVDGVPIYDGADIFKCMDSHGMPLTLMLPRCAFDWLTFVEAAKRSGNYTFEKLWREVKESFLDLGWSTEVGEPSFADKFKFLWFQYRATSVG